MKAAGKATVESGEWVYTRRGKARKVKLTMEVDFSPNDISSTFVNGSRQIVFEGKGNRSISTPPQFTDFELS